MTEIVAKCTHGIDLHTAANHRDNLPQIRGNLDDAETLSLAKQVPEFLYCSTPRSATARYAGRPLDWEFRRCSTRGCPLRFNELAIRPGVEGIINVMRTWHAPALAPAPPWRRALRGSLKCGCVRPRGMFRSAKPLGARVEQGEPIGTIADPFGVAETTVIADHSGLVIGRTQLPIVHQGDALFHVARFEDVGEVAQQVEDFQAAQDNS